MRHILNAFITTSLVFCSLISMGIAEQQTMSHAEHDMLDEPVPEFNATGTEPMSYALFPDDKGLFYTHVAFMAVAFLLLMPIGVMLGIAKSSFHVPVQILTFAFAMGGFFFGKLYGHSTPQLYAGNIHHSFGWALFALLCIQAFGGIVRKIANAVKHSTEDGYERISLMQQPHHDPQQRGSRVSESGSSLVSETTTLNHSPSNGSTSGDGNHFPLTEGDIGYTHHNDEDGALMADSLLEDRYYVDDPIEPLVTIEQRRGANSVLHSVSTKILSHTPQFIKSGFRKAADNRFTNTFCRYLHFSLGRLFIVLIFTQTISGLVVYHGVCRDWEIFGCIAHLIKGAIFYFYGMITFARYLGAFAEKGWAWNYVKDGNSFSFEMIECSLIFLYGITNTWLEHLGSDSKWTHKDLEHASLAFMFWWAGLLGILIESRRFRRLLERVIPKAATPRLSSNEATDYALNNYKEAEDKKTFVHSPSGSSSSTTFTNDTAIDKRNTSPSNSLHFNPMPAITVFMTGISMGNHHQDTIYSSRVHYLWGMLIAAAAVCRVITYFSLFRNPPTTSQPSRPPSEAAGAFLLTGGAILFMASNAGTILFLRRSHVDSMFLLNLTVSFTSMTLAYVTFLMIVKAWAMDREERKKRGTQQPSTAKRGRTAFFKHGEI